MKQLRLRVSFGIFGILAILGSVALVNPHKATAQSGTLVPNNGASYLTTVKDSNGNYAASGSHHVRSRL
jgi:hypothetical protein